ncbi:MAG: 50S ribosomal protein L29 [Deltaproteobacteria bacterium]|nr:50S ribosomal protein L29 [Deltaproteobacteria bacterium]
MKASEIRGMSVEEIKNKCEELKKELFHLKLRHSTGQLDKPVKMGFVKRDIARLKTVIAEKKRAK